MFDLICAALLMLQQRNTDEKYIKNYVFDYDFGGRWGKCEVTMTSVLGHLTSVEFPPDYKRWESPPPESLFSAPIKVVIPDVRLQHVIITVVASPDTTYNRTRRKWLQT